MIELFTLGSVDLRSETDRIEAVLSQPKRTALLAYLAVARPRGFHARDSLLALFWPESDRRRARSSLRKALHFLRRHLGKDAIVSSGDALSVSPKAWCDVVAFDRAVDEGQLREALELYGGDLLSGFHVTDAPEFERWLDGERRRLKRTAVRTAWELSETEEAAGRIMEAARLGHRARTLDPLDEMNTRRLMRLLHRLGDRAGALRVYEQAAELLRDDMGVEPTAAIRDLHDRIRRGEPTGSFPEGGDRPWAPVRRSGTDGAEAASEGDRGASDERSAEGMPGGGEGTNPRGGGGTGETLDSPGVGSGEVKPRPAGRVRSVLLGAVLAAVLLAGGLSINELASGEGAEAVAADASSTVAVLPFGIAGDEDALWREGMVTLLSTNLLGANGLEVRAPEHVIKLWDTDFGDDVPASPAALEAGRRLGTGWVVTGRLTGRGDDLRLTGEARRVADGGRIGPVVVDGPRDSLFSLVDRFTVELLRGGLAPGDHRGLPVDLSRVTTTSLEALEAYLRGERAWRSAELRAAADAFSQAIRYDSTFALAHYRLANARGWTGPPNEVIPHLRAALRHVDRLHDREATLVRGELAIREGRVMEGLDSLRALTIREPRFAPGWVRLGDAVLHDGLRFLVPRVEFRHALRTAVDVNPLAAEPYWHLIEDAFFRDDRTEAERLVEAYRRVDPNSAACVGYETAFLLTWGDESARRSAASRLDTLGGGARQPLGCSLAVLRLSPTHRDALEIVAAEMESEDRPVDEHRRARSSRLAADIRGGRIAEARAKLERDVRREADRSAARTLLMLDLVAYPDEDAATVAVRALAQGTPSARDLFWSGASGLHRGRRADARRAAASLRAHPDSGSAASFLAEVLETLALPPEASESAGHRLAELQIRMSANPFIHEWLRLHLGRTFLELGQPDLALRYLQSIPMFSSPFQAPSFLLQGKAHEAMGETAAAREAYARFLRWWGDADPEFEPMRREARTALRRLVAPGS